MDQLMIAALGNSVSGGFISAAMSIVALISGIIFYFKKTNIEEISSVGTLQHHQIESLLSQVTMLSKELALAREQLSEIHNQNMKLMQQIRDSNLRIQELEYTLHDQTKQKKAEEL